MRAAECPFAIAPRVAAGQEAKEAGHAAAYHQHQRLRRGRTDEQKRPSAEAFRRYRNLGYEVDDTYPAWSAAVDRAEAAACISRSPASPRGATLAANGSPSMTRVVEPAPECGAPLAMRFESSDSRLNQTRTQTAFCQ